MWLAHDEVGRAVRGVPGMGDGAGGRGGDAGARRAAPRHGRAGERGVGKSTLLLEAGAQAAQAGPVLYVTGEESAGQVRLRADRIGAVHADLFLAAESGLPAVLGHVEAVEPRLLIVDSVQTIA